MAVTDTDLLVIERGGTLYKAPVSDLPSGGGGGVAGLTLLQKETITTDVGAVDFDLPSGYTNFRLLLSDIGIVSTSVQGMRLRISTDGGDTFITTSYKGLCLIREYGFGSSTSPNSTGLNAFFLIPSPGGASPDSMSGAWDISVSATYCDLRGMFSLDTSTGQAFGRRIVTTAPDAIRVFAGSGDLDAGTLSLYGYREDV